MKHKTAVVATKHSSNYTQWSQRFAERTPELWRRSHQYWRQRLSMWQSTSLPSSFFERQEERQAKPNGDGCATGALSQTGMRSPSSHLVARMQYEPLEELLCAAHAHGVPFLINRYDSARPEQNGTAGTVCTPQNATRRSIMRAWQSL